MREVDGQAREETTQAVVAVPFAAPIVAVEPSAGTSDPAVLPVHQ